MKKLLHLVDSLAVGGAEKLITGVINNLDDYEHHLMILDEPETLKKSITADYTFSNLHAKTKWELARAVRKIKKYIRENKIDIVHAHLYNAIILSRMATPSNIPLFNTIHAISSLAAYKVNRLTLYIEKLTYRKRHHIVAVSQEVLKDFEKHVGLKGPATVLYNFIDNVFFETTPKTEFSRTGLRLVAVGNLRYQKNYPYLLEAFKKIPAGVSLDIYGEGAMRGELQQEIDRHQLNIRLCGLRDQMQLILPQYDALVMSSFYEGQPLSLLEAMAMGLPAFLADIPVLREVAGDNGIYFDINDPDSLGRQIQQALDGKIDLKRLSLTGRQKVAAFARPEIYFEKLRRLYSEL